MVDFQYKDSYGVKDLEEIVRLLRAPGGCPWDAEQTHQSIRRNFLEEAYEAIRRLQEAGLTFDAHIMTGVAGKGRGEENALALARFLNQTHPAHVVNFSMFLHKEVPLYREAERGAFTQADELECLKEELSLIERAGTEEYPISYDGFHDFIEFRVRGILPRDREKMKEKLQAEIRKYERQRPVYSLVYGECPNIIRCEGDERIY